MHASLVRLVADAVTTRQALAAVPGSYPACKPCYVAVMTGATDIEPSRRGETNYLDPSIGLMTTTYVDDNGMVRVQPSSFMSIDMAGLSPSLTAELSAMGAESLDNDEDDR